MRGREKQRRRVPQPTTLFSICGVRNTRTDLNCTATHNHSLLQNSRYLTSSTIPPSVSESALLYLNPSGRAREQVLGNVVLPSGSRSGPAATSPIDKAVSCTPVPQIATQDIQAWEISICVVHARTRTDWRMETNYSFQIFLGFLSLPAVSFSDSLSVCALCPLPFPPAPPSRCAAPGPPEPRRPTVTTRFAPSPALLALSVHPPGAFRDETLVVLPQLLAEEVDVRL